MVLADTITPYWHFFGAFHSAVVHFPIALLTVAGGVEFFSMIRRKQRPSNTAMVCLTLGTGAAIVAAALGWANADASGETSGEVVTLHRWLGVGVVALAVTALATATALRYGVAKRAVVWAYRGGVFGVAALVGLAGSYGGQLVHGTDYYPEAYAALQQELAELRRMSPPTASVAVRPPDTQPSLESPSNSVNPAAVASAPTLPLAVASSEQPATSAPAFPTTEPAARAELGPTTVSLSLFDPAPEPLTQPLVPTAPAVAAAVEQRVDFNRDIKPIFESNCFKCHGENKKKGDFRLDLREHALSAGESGEPAIVPGSSEKSLLVKMIEAQGEFADSRMPPKGDPLTADQIAIIRRWIDQGAEWAPQ